MIKFTPTTLLKKITFDELQHVAIYDSLPDTWGGSEDFYFNESVIKKEDIPQLVKKVEEFLNDHQGNDFYIYLRKQRGGKSGGIKGRLFIPFEGEEIQEDKNNIGLLSKLEKIEELEERLTRNEQADNRRQIMLDQILGAFLNPFVQKFETALNGITDALTGSLEQLQQTTENQPTMSNKNTPLNGEQLTELEQAFADLINLFGEEGIITLTNKLKENPSKVKMVKTFI